MPTKMSDMKLRIIAGRWRGRKFSFPAIPGLRPTPERVRETLFNWLTPYIAGAKCLDLFAGSGALGLEALSRGASRVDFVDAAPEVIAHLKTIIQQLQIANARVQQAKISEQLPLCCEPPYDIIFLDPPFHQNLIGHCCNWLDSHNWIAPNGLVYLESEIRLTSLPLPANWKLLKNSQAGQVHYALVCNSVGN